MRSRWVSKGTFSWTRFRRRDAKTESSANQKPGILRVSSRETRRPSWNFLNFRRAIRVKLANMAAGLSLVSVDEFIISEIREKFTYVYNFRDYEWKLQHFIHIPKIWLSNWNNKSILMHFWEFNVKQPISLVVTDFCYHAVGPRSMPPAIIFFLRFILYFFCGNLH